MPRKIAAFFLLFSLLFLSSCQSVLTPPEEPSFSEETWTGELSAAGNSEREEPVSDPSPDPDLDEANTKDSSVSPPSGHQHRWSVSSQIEPTCTKTGKKIWICTCGAIKEEVLAETPHTFGEAGCTEAPVCLLCGEAEGAPLGHLMSGNTCTRCHLHISSPIYVLGKELLFDESRESIVAKLGTPTETMIEGNLKSLVYARDFTRLTVIQIDENGLWGVFTFDPIALLFVDGKSFSLATFSGREDINSDAFYQEVGSCQVYGFRDAPGDGSFYALWLHYIECDYDYMNDVRLYQNYEGQSRLSFYYINALRARHGLPALSWSSAAAGVAVSYSEEMAVKNFFYHDNLYTERLTRAGVFWKYAGENISQGYYNALFVCDAYYNSQSHRDNILSTEFTYVGMGYYRKTSALSVLGAQIFYS